MTNRPTNHTFAIARRAGTRNAHPRKLERFDLFRNSIMGEKAKNAQTEMTSQAVQ